MEIPGGMPVGNMNGMQRPQSGNPNQQIHAKIMQDLRNSSGQLPAGWQSTFDIGQRTNRTMQLVSQLRFLNPDIIKCMAIAQNFEMKSMIESPSKEAYLERMARKMADVTNRRQAQANMMQQQQLNMGMPMNNGMMGNMNNMPNPAMGGFNGMNMGMAGGMGVNMNANMNMGNMGNLGINMPNGGMGMPNEAVNGAGNVPPQGRPFPNQLQQQMRPSPVPPQQTAQQQPQPQQPAQNNNTMDPSALQNNQMSQLTNQLNGMPQNMGQALPGQPGGPGNGPSQQEVWNVARKLYSQVPEDRKVALRQSILSSLSDQQRATFTNSPGDLLFKFFVGKARDTLVKQRVNQTAGGQPQLMGGMPMGNNMGMPNNGMTQQPNQQQQQQQQQQQTPAQQQQQQQSQQQTQPQQQGGQGMQQGGQTFDFTRLAGQQANARKSQESGEQVVPASNNNGNNNMNFGNQMGMPANMNPQMLANANAQNGGPGMVQFFQMQQQKQRQAAQQQQQNRANQQQQGVAQPNQLHGQPGGLNAQNALNGSPAMNMTMLNRPIAPPGQQPTSAAPTPQQNRPGGATGPANGANQVAQHFKNMVNQNQQGMPGAGQQGLTEQQRMLMMAMPPALQERLSTVPPEQANQILARFAAQRNQAMSQNMMNGMQVPPGMPPNANLAGLQANNGQQPAMLNGMPTGMGPAAGQFNANAPPFPQPGQQQMDQSAQIQDRLQQHQQSQMRQRAMDLRPFPKALLVRLRAQVPPQVMDWGKLKQHVATNPTGFPPNTLENVQMAQTSWFDAHPEEMQLGIQTLRQLMQNAQAQAGVMAGQQPQLGQRPGQATMPGNQNPGTQNPGNTQVKPPMAPTQQAVNRNMGPGMNMLQGRPPIQPPTAQEIQTFREKVPNAQGWSDDQIRGAIMRRKLMMMNPNAQQGMQRSQAMKPGQVAPQMGQPGAVPNANQQQRLPQQQSAQPPGGAAPQPSAAAAQGQKRPSVANDDVMEIANPNAAQSQPPQAPAMQASLSQQPQPQQQQPQPQRQRLPTPAEIAKMPPQQRQEIQLQMQRMRDAALRKAQMGIPGNTQAPQTQAPSTQQQAPTAPPPQQPPQVPAAMPHGITAPTQADRDRLAALFQEVARDNPKGPAVQLDSNGVKVAQALLKKLWGPSLNMDKTYLTALKVPNLGEERLKQAMRAKIIVMQNAADAQGTIKDHLSVTPQELQGLERFVAGYFMTLKQVNEMVKASKAQGQSGAQSAAQPAPTAQAQPRRTSNGTPKTQPTAMGRTASQSGPAGRKASAAANQKVPAAPTEDKTFDWGASSPHGVPKYEMGRNDLTADKLKIPPPKRRRTQTGDTSVSTPASQPSVPAVTASPGMPSGKPSPEQMRKLQQIKMEQQQREAAERAKFRCSEPFCNASIQGFETEEMLKQHVESEHQPVDDPLQFLLESAATALGVDQEGKPLVRTVAAEEKDTRSQQTQAKSRPGAAAVRTTSKTEHLTPKNKPDLGTPTTPSSIGRPKPGATPASGKTAQPKNVDAVNNDGFSADREPTLLEAMASKIGLELPSSDPDLHSVEAPDTSLEESTEWTDLWHSVFDSAGDPTSIGGDTSALLGDDWTLLSNVTDWGLRPEHQQPHQLSVQSESSPELTPSSGASSSSFGSYESDLSLAERLRLGFEWDAFGNGDVGVPSSLLQHLAVGNHTQNDQDTVDAIMQDASSTAAGRSDNDNNNNSAGAGGGADGSESNQQQKQSDEKDKSSAEAKKDADMWDWSADLTDWDLMVGDFGDGSASSSSPFAVFGAAGSGGSGAGSGNTKVGVAA